MNATPDGENYRSPTSSVKSARSREEGLPSSPGSRNRLSFDRPNSLGKWVRHPCRCTCPTPQTARTRHRCVTCAYEGSGYRSNDAALGTVTPTEAQHRGQNAVLGNIERPAMMLDERKAAILRAVVEEYIETAQPVGSGHVAPAVNVSSATVRNELATLEQEGYLHQPHTSAGRVPREKGYRYFVDSLTGPGTLGASQVHQVRSFFATAHGELEQM